MAVRKEDGTRREIGSIWKEGGGGRKETSLKKEKFRSFPGGAKKLGDPIGEGDPSEFQIRRGGSSFSIKALVAKCGRLWRRAGDSFVLRYFLLQFLPYGNTSMETRSNAGRIPPPKRYAVSFCISGIMLLAMIGKGECSATGTACVLELFDS